MRSLLIFIEKGNRFAAGCLIALLLTVAAQAWSQDDGLKFVHSPGGGEIVYGPVVGQTTSQGAMEFMLKTIHSRFGDSPRTGRFFRTTGSKSTATFFTLTDKKNGGKQIAGLVIVAVSENGEKGAKPTAAVIYDDADHFAKSANPMMQKLNEVWKPEANKSRLEFSGSDTSSSGLAEPLHETAFADNSGSIGLPDGWKIASSAMGSAQVTGPNGEELYMGFYIPVADAKQNHLVKSVRTLSEKYVTAEYGDDPFKMLVSVAAQLRDKQHLGPVAIDLIRKQDQGNHCSLLKVNLDRHDGKGEMLSLIRLCTIPSHFPAWWGIAGDQAILPKEVAEKEMPTIQAMAKSYRTNDTVIREQMRQVVGRFDYRKAGATAEERARAERAQIEHESHDAQRDLGSDRVKNFSEYLLDDKSLGDASGKGSAVADSYAEELVKAYPNLYEFVADQDLLKDVDY